VAAGDCVSEGLRFLIHNLGHEPRTFENPVARGRVALTTHLDRPGEEVDGALELRGDEGVIVEIA
jgi:hypothetical protein